MNQEIQEFLKKGEEYFQHSEEILEQFQKIRILALNYEPAEERRVDRFSTKYRPGKKVTNYRTLDNKYFILSFGKSKSAFLISDSRDIQLIFDSISDGGENIPAYDLCQIILGKYPQFPIITHQCDSKQLQSLMKIIREFYADKDLKIENENEGSIIINRLYQNKQAVDHDFLKLEEHVKIKDPDLINIISLPPMEQKDDTQYFRHLLRPSALYGYIAPMHITINHIEQMNGNNVIGNNSGEMNISHFIPPLPKELYSEHHARYNPQLSKAKYDGIMHSHGYKKKRSKRGYIWRLETD